MGGDLSGGRPVDGEAVRKQVELLNALAALRTPSERVVHAGIPVLLALTTLSIAWLIAVPAPHVDIEAIVGRVSVPLGEPETGSSYTLSGFPPLKRLVAGGLQTIQSDIPTLDEKAGPGAVGSIDLAAGAVALSRVELGPADGSNGTGHAPSIAIERVGSLWQIEVTGLMMTAQLSVEPPVKVATAFGSAKREATPGNASLSLKGATGSKLSFEPAHDGSTFEVPPLRPRALGFMTTLYDARGTKMLVSTIKSGSVSFEGDAKRHNLAAAAVLTLRDLAGVVRVHAEGATLKVSYSGRVGTVELAGQDADKARDLRPSLAEWLGADKDVALFWSGLVFLTGLALSVRRSLA